MKSTLFSAVLLAGLLSFSPTLSSCSSSGDANTLDDANISGSGGAPTMGSEFPVNPTPITAGAANTAGAGTGANTGSENSDPGVAKAGAAGASPEVGMGGATSGGAGGETAMPNNDPPLDPDAVRRSVGCGSDADIEPGEFVRSDTLGRGTWVRLPPGYDPERAYPVLFVWKGCTATNLTTFGIETVAGADAIIAQGDFPPGAECYDTADGAQFVDLPLFDALLEQITTNYCVDEAHLFALGMSSGAWLTQLLGCQRGDVLRGIASIAGGFKPSFLNGLDQCPGHGLASFMLSDLDDHENPFYDEDEDGDSVQVAVDHWLTTNGCTEQAWAMGLGEPSEPNPEICRSYSNCGDYPVKLCLTTGQGHGDQREFAMPAFWEFFKQFLPQ